MSLTINDKIIEQLNILKEKTLMVLSSYSRYEDLQNYLEGYIDGVSLQHGLNLRLEITKWFQQKTALKTSYYWTNQILHYYPDLSDKERCNFLLDTTKDFFQENPFWYDLSIT